MAKEKIALSVQAVDHWTLSFEFDLQEDMPLVTAARPTVRVELLDAQERPLPGFELESCQPLKGDQLRHRVAWQRRDLTGLQERPVQIRFVLDRASLYGYYSECG